MLASKKINKTEIAAFILEHHCYQLTGGSNEVNAIHEHKYQKYVFIIFQAYFIILILEMNWNFLEPFCIWL